MRRPFSQPSMAGFSLIEVLVAVLILSIGLLGAAGLHTSSLRMNQSAWNTTQANLLAAGMVETLRSNPRGVRAGDYDRELGLDPASGGGRAGREIDHWLDILEARLPTDDGRVGGGIEVDGDVVTVEVAWLDARWEEDPEERYRSVIVETEL